MVVDGTCFVLFGAPGFVLSLDLKTAALYEVKEEENRMVGTIRNPGLTLQLPFGILGLRFSYHSESWAYASVWDHTSLKTGFWWSI